MDVLHVILLLTGNYISRLYLGSCGTSTTSNECWHERLTLQLVSNQRTDKYIILCVTSHNIALFSPILVGWLYNTFLRPVLTVVGHPTLNDDELLYRLFLSAFNELEIILYVYTKFQKGYEIDLSSMSWIEWKYLGTRIWLVPVWKNNNFQTQWLVFCKKKLTLRYLVLR